MFSIVKPHDTRDGRSGKECSVELSHVIIRLVGLEKNAQYS